MTEAVPFTDNYRDLSNSQGYQFEFVCERCGSGYRSPFDRSITGVGSSVLGAASSVLGGRLWGATRGVEELNRLTNSTGKDKALKKAAEAVMPSFRQCLGCGNWFCHEVCWNHETNQCVNCTPRLAHEVTRAQSQAQIDQARKDINARDWTAGVNTGDRTASECSNCGAESSGAKFCGNCGTAFHVEVTCPSCQATNPPGTNFCGSCGTRL